MRITRFMPRATGLALPVLLAPAVASAQFLEPVDVVATLIGDQPGANYGWALADIGDLNGDGAPDLISGENLYFVSPDDAFPSGRVTVLSGATGGVLYEFVPENGGRLGYAISSAGDVDGDGTEDILGGAPYRLGMPGGVATVLFGAADVYSGATGELLLTIEPPVTLGTFFGAAVASAGDLDHDGLSDILVGAPDAAFFVGEDKAYIFSGADGSLLRTYAPDVPNEAFGWAAANAGDIDGDGADDHLIGAPFAFKVYLFSGATGDLLHVFEGPPDSGAYGQFFTDGLKDLNADGVRDIFVGDYAYQPDPMTFLGPGAGYIYSGADFSLIRQIVGPTPTSGLGPGRNAGDVDDDGREDLIIGHYTSSEGAPNAGKVTVYSGADGSELVNFTYTVENAQMGFDAVGIGDVTGDGGPDFALSAASGDTVIIAAGPTPPCIADADRDGARTFADLHTFLDLWFAWDPAADIDNSGEIDLRDFFLFFRAWIRGC
ncbi:MAG: integrin alpha [Planctomycetota bacterium]